MRKLGVTLLVLSACGGGTKTIVEIPSSPLRVYRVPSCSMEPTIGVGTYVYLETTSPSPSVGDIAVFHPPEGAEQEECGPTPHIVKLGGAACTEPIPRPSNVQFIKRIVAGPRDELYVTEGHVYRRAAETSQFIREQDSYIRPCGASPECNFPTPIKVPAGEWYTLGDNRGESDDSRFWGAIPTEWIVGIVRWCVKIGNPCPT